MMTLSDEVTHEHMIKETLNALLRDKFYCDDEKIKLMGENRLLSSKIGFSAANIFELFLEIEKAFEISFTKQEILNTQFDNYNELVEIINQKIRGVV